MADCEILFVWAEFEGGENALFFAVEAVGVFGDRDGHGDHCEDLEEVGLDHVFDCADFVEITGAFFDAEFFEGGDFDFGDLRAFEH